MVATKKKAKRSKSMKDPKDRSDSSRVPGDSLADVAKRVDELEARLSRLERGQMTTPTKDKPAEGEPEEEKKPE
jgi:hypothetical protein